MTEPRPLTFDRLAHDVAAAQDALLDARPLPPAPSLSASSSSSSSSSGFWPRFALGAGGVCAAAVVVLVVSSTSEVTNSPAPSIANSTKPTPAAMTTASVAPPARAAGRDDGVWVKDAHVFAFEDGSHVDAAVGSRVRVRGGPDRTVVDVERGRVSGTVKGGFVVEAGAYEVAFDDVDGGGDARFALSWRPGDEALALQLSHGGARVTGPGLAAARVVAAGQSVAFRAGALVDDAPAATPTKPETSETAGSEAKPETPTTTTAPPSTTWTTPADPAAAVDAARARGLDVVTAEASAAELQKLATAARRADAKDVARAVHEGIRARFAGSAEAAASAFFLGRAAVDVEGDDVKGARLLRACIDEAPDGPLAPEATGRLIEALARSGHRDDAVARAGAYLARWPDGSYAAFARALVAQTTKQPSKQPTK